MATNGYIALAVLICMLITWALRAIPFALLRPIQESEFLAYIGERMPLGIMTILSVYTLRNTPLTTQGLAFTAIAVLTTLVLHLWRNDFTLSVFSGTTVFTLLMSLTTTTGS